MKLRFRKELAPALSSEVVDGLVDAGIRLEDAKRQAKERRDVGGTVAYGP